MADPDAAGRTWRVGLTLGVLGAIKREAGVDLAGALTSPAALADFLFGDPARLGAAAWHAVGPDARASGVGFDDFAGAIDGPALGRAAEALLAAAVGFFPRSAVGARFRADLPGLLAEMDRVAVEAIVRARSRAAGGRAAGE